MDGYARFAPEGRFGHYLMAVSAAGGADCTAWTLYLFARGKRGELDLTLWTVGYREGPRILVGAGSAAGGVSCDWAGRVVWAGASRTEAITKQRSPCVPRGGKALRASSASLRPFGCLGGSQGLWVGV